MKQNGSKSIDSIAEFFAYAYMLVCESADRYQEMADSLEVHNNLQVAGLFQKMADYAERLVQDVSRRAEGIDLPDIPPWGFSWTCPQSPETTCSDSFHYLMSARQAVEVALHNEIRSSDFYAQIARESADESVRHIALEFATKAQRHIDMLEQWMVKATADSDAPQEDLDPPNVT